MEKCRKIFRVVASIIFLVQLVFSSLSCFSQTLTTRAPEDMGMTDGYDFYVFWLNNEARISPAMTFINDTIYMSPYNLKISSELFRAVGSHQLVHYYNYVSHGEIIKTDTLRQDVQNNSNIDSIHQETSPDLSKIVYRGGDGSSIYKAIIIKRSPTLEEGIAAEYAYLEKKLGQRGIDWKPLGQYLHPDYNKRYDIIKVNIIETNEIKHFWFDITNFFGKSYIYFTDKELK
jgi:hypothetical protein